MSFAWKRSLETIVNKTARLSALSASVLACRQGELLDAWRFEKEDLQRLLRECVPSRAL